MKIIALILIASCACAGARARRGAVMDAGTVHPSPPLGGMELWLDASTLTNLSSKVIWWTDLSPKGRHHHVQATNNNVPIPTTTPYLRDDRLEPAPNGQYYVEWIDNATQLSGTLVGPENLPPESREFLLAGLGIVFSIQDASVSRQIVGLNAVGSIDFDPPGIQNKGLWMTPTTLEWRMVSTSSYSLPSLYTWHLAVFWTAGGSIKSVIDGNYLSAAGVDWGVEGNGDLVIGGGISGGIFAGGLPAEGTVNPFGGYIATVIAYNGSFDANQATNLYRYLARRYFPNDTF